MGRAATYFAPHLRHNLSVGLEQIVAAHAGLARQPCRNDHNIGVISLVVGIAADHAHVETFDWRCLRQVQRFALWHTLNNVDQHDIAKFLCGGPVGGCRTNITCANNSNLISRTHFFSSFRGQQPTCSSDSSVPACICDFGMLGFERARVYKCDQGVSRKRGFGLWALGFGLCTLRSEILDSLKCRWIPITSTERTKYKAQSAKQVFHHV